MSLLAPLYTIAGLIVLLIPPAVFHLAAFGRSRKYLHIVISVLVGEFVLTLILLLFGFFHLFYGWLVLVVTVLVAGILGWFIRAKNVSAVSEISLSPRAAGFILLATALFFVIQMPMLIDPTTPKMFGIRIFDAIAAKFWFSPFTADSLGAYLPWAREIAESNYIVPFSVNVGEYTFGYPPLLHTHAGYLLSLFGFNNEAAPAAVPLLFLAATILIIFLWGQQYMQEREQEHVDETVPLFGLICLLASPIVYGIGIKVLQDPPLMFFTTAAFFMLFNYLKTKQDVFLILTVLSTCMCNLSKYNGLIISLVIFLVLLIKCRTRTDWTKITLLFIFFNIPFICWSIRNFYCFDNPVFPILSGLFRGPYNSPVYEVPIASTGLYLRRTASGVISSLPVLIPAIAYMFKNRNKAEVQIVVSAFMVLLAFVAVSATYPLARYYLFPFLGILTVFAGIEVAAFFESNKTLKTQKRRIATLLLIALVICVPFTYFHTVTAEECVQWENDENTVKHIPEIRNSIVFVDKGAGPALSWYYNVTQISLVSRQVRVIINGSVRNNESAEYYYTVFKKLRLNYIYDTVYDDSDDLQYIFEVVDNDTANYTLIYNTKGNRVWKVR